MIVKNESKIIVRLLESVYRIIDTYVICDTGSTDDTLAIMVDFLTSKGIKGKYFMSLLKILVTTEPSLWKGREIKLHMLC
jgi:glycosyltransferase involved in cell wall biosynthesis